MLGCTFGEEGHSVGENVKKVGQDGSLRMIALAGSDERPQLPNLGLVCGKALLALVSCKLMSVSRVPGTLLLGSEKRGEDRRTAHQAGGQGGGSSVQQAALARIAIVIHFVHQHVHQYER
jgi:hypothetical protein